MAKKKAAVDPSTLDPAEAARRAEQKRKQTLALKLRAEGKEYGRKRKAPEAGTMPSTSGRADAPKRVKGERTAPKALRDVGGTGIPGSRHATAQHRKPSTEQHREYAKPEAEDEMKKVKGRVQVVIIPIYWNRRDQRDDKIKVVKLCREVKQTILDAGVYVWLDVNEDLLPGQRMRYWEEEGVKVRVEIGPQDAAKGQCILAQVTGKPGEMARKTTLKVDASLAEKLTQALGATPAHKAAETAKRSKAGGK